MQYVLAEMGKRKKKEKHPNHLTWPIAEGTTMRSLLIVNGSGAVGVAISLIGGTPT